LVQAHRRRRAGDGPAERVLHAWTDASEILSLRGARRRPDETPLEHAARIPALLGIDHEALERLAELATAALYSAEMIGDEQAAECDALRLHLARALMAQAPWRTRIRIRITPKLAAAIS
jgi:hypothetical protein